MQKTAVKSDKELEKEALKRAQEKDYKRAEVLMKTIAELEEEAADLVTENNKAKDEIYATVTDKIAKLDLKHKEQLDPIELSMSSAKNEILEIANRNRQKFGPDDNWRFNDLLHYLHLKSETKALQGKTFDIAKFIKKYGQFIKWEFRVAALKKVFTDADERKRIMKYDIDLKIEKTPEIKKAKEEETAE